MSYCDLSSKKLEQVNIDYCLMGDHDRLDQFANGGEIDLLVRDDQLRQLGSLLAQLGFVRLPNAGHAPHHFFVAYDEDTDSWFKLHVFTEEAFARRLFTQWWRYLTARYHRARGRLVIFDRYSYDALLSSHRRLGRLKRWRRFLLAHACPAPDLVLMLDAPGELRYARKGEHNAAILEHSANSNWNCNYDCHKWSSYLPLAALSTCVAKSFL